MIITCFRCRARSISAATSELEKFNSDEAAVASLDSGTWKGWSEQQKYTIPNEKGKTVYQDLREAKREKYDKTGTTNVGSTKIDAIKLAHLPASHAAKALKPEDDQAQTDPALKKAMKDALGHLARVVRIVERAAA